MKWLKYLMGRGFTQDQARYAISAMQGERMKGASEVWGISLGVPVRLVGHILPYRRVCRWWPCGPPPSRPPCACSCPAAANAVPNLGLFTRHGSRVLLYPAENLH